MTVIDQKRIATNSILLYIRMIVVMLIGFLSSRVILNALGEVDFGVYDAVGGIILNVSFISGTMSTACQRWYSYELGRNNTQGLKQVFNLSLSIFLIISLIIVLLAETVGLWWLNKGMNVANRIDAAKWVYQFSVLAFLFIIIRLPFQGMVIAKEKMKVFAYLAIFESVATLGIAVVIYYSNNDRLILYAFLMMCIQFLTTSFYWLYCRIYYQECRLEPYFEKDKFKELFSFASWNMIGATADSLKVHGVNLLLNNRFGVLANAPRGVAYKVFNSISKLNTDFFTAVKPQLIKSYAAGQLDEMKKLICQSSRFSFYLMFLLTLPIMLETPPILEFWLKGRFANVPEMSVIFTRLVLADGLLNTLTSPLATSMQATGKIRNYQLVLGTTLLTIVPLAYIGIKYFGLPAPSVFIITLVIDIICQFIRVQFIRKGIGLEHKTYLKEVILPILLVSISSSVPAIALHWAGIHFIITIFASIAFAGISAFFIGMTGSERKHTLDFVWNLIDKINFLKK